MKLSDRIWITRKSRIEAANRLEWNASISQFLIAYYSVFSVIFAILDIKDTSKDYSYQFLIASVCTLAVSIYVPSMRFGERALALKKCYVGLYRLVRKANNAEKLENGTEIEKIDLEYDCKPPLVSASYNYSSPVDVS